MELTGQYLTYSEYQELGGTLDQTPFNLFEFNARKIIDRNTQNRLKNIDVENIPSEVKLCVFNLINCIDKYAETINEINGNVESENIDGYSIKYITQAQVNEIIKSKDFELNDIVETQLFGVIVNNEHIIYLGVK